MENKPPASIFGSVHQKIQEKKDETRRAREDKAQTNRRAAEEEAKIQGFDRTGIEPGVPES